jgi:hypothetical protein
MSVPPVPFTFANRGSRSFTAAAGHRVWLVGNLAPLRKMPEITMSAWFRSTTGVGRFTIGNDDSIWLTARQIVWERRVTLNGGFNYCIAYLTSHLDGQWHHLAGVDGPDGMRLYLDGIERCSGGRGGGANRNDPVSATADGDVDDLRVYKRALTAAEIARLAAGGQ